MAIVFLSLIYFGNTQIKKNLVIKTEILIVI